ncbi:MAG: hypothetical protein HYX21_01710 [Candidatus Yanofskybacteria bacterium]|nr:hypothetical protein [Candidatus Yanofskybacteria bacterium]
MDQKSVSSTSLLLDFLNHPGSIRSAREEASADALLLETNGSYDLDKLREAYKKRLWKNPEDAPK